MFSFRGNLIALCPSCRAILLPLRGYVCSASGEVHHKAVLAPNRVVVMHKTSRLEFERKRHKTLSERHKHLSERELQTELSNRLGPHYNVLQQRHSAQKRHLDEIDKFLSSQGISIRWRDRESYSASDVEWADTIFAAGGDGNFLFAASKVFTSNKIVVGLNTDPSWSEGYLCLCPSQSSSLTDILKQAFTRHFPVIQRWRIRVTLDGNVLPVRALNEVFVGEKNLSHSAYYELRCDELRPEKQKSSGLLVYTGTGSTSWAYNVNKLMPFQVSRLLELAQQESLTSDPSRQLSETNMEEGISRVTRQFNESIWFDGGEKKMAYAVREPIVRGVFAANNTHGFANRVEIRSLSWNATLVVDGLSPGYDLKRGGVATCQLHPQDCLTTLDPRHTTVAS